MFELEVDLAPPGTLAFHRNGKLQYVVRGLDCKDEHVVSACLYHAGTKVTLFG